MARVAILHHFFILFARSSRVHFGQQIRLKDNRSHPSSKEPHTLCHYSYSCSSFGREPSKEKAKEKAKKEKKVSPSLPHPLACRRPRPRWGAEPLPRDGFSDHASKFRRFSLLVASGRHARFVTSSHSWAMRSTDDQVRGR